MDLGCLDMGCIEKQKNQSSFDSNDSPFSSSKFGKNKTTKDTTHSSMNALNKFTSQIRKPPRRKGSPLNWFPRMKIDSYLKRKIKLLQEVDGMNSTLDETLGDSNPHYSRVLREKIAVREAAHKAMEARKAAMVEASWCRILQASHIESKEAQALLLKAEKIAAEAFEAATAIGVIMYDIPDCTNKHYEIETSHINGGESTTHAVTASFETAFEVDKQVAAAVKAAFINLASCSSINKNEFKELLRKISQNPDTDDSTKEISEFSSECESDTGSELESGSLNNNICPQEFDGEVLIDEGRQRKFKKQQISEKLRMTKLVDMMLERLKCLQEDELASLATIVATCGLNAALAESENYKQHSLGAAAAYTPAVNLPRRVSSFGAGRTRNINMDGKQVETELPSLDKFLVKRLTRLEREVQEAKNSGRNEATEGCGEKPDNPDDEKVCSVGKVLACKSTDLGSILVKHKSKFEKEIEEARKKSGLRFGKNHKLSNSDSNSSEVVPDFGSLLTRKHVSKLEKEIEETKRNYGNLYESNGKKPERVHNRAFGQTTQDGTEIPSLDKVLVKHMSRLEREVQEAKNERKREPEEGCILFSDRDQVGKENIDLNEEGNLEVDMKQKGIPQDSAVETSVPIEQPILDAAEALSIQDDSTGLENSLDKILVKPVHRLEREKMQALSVGSDDYRVQWYKKRDGGTSVADCEGLDKVLVKHFSRLEKEKMKLGTKEEEVIKVVKRRDINTQLEKKERSLDQILVKPKSRLEREKIAAVQQPEDQKKHSATRREAREKELLEAWGGISLGNSIRPHQSQLERDKAAWLKAEEEERMRAMEQV